MTHPHVNVKTKALAKAKASSKVRSNANANANAHTNANTNMGVGGGATASENSLPLLAQTLDEERALLVNVNANLAAERSLTQALRLAQALAKDEQTSIFVGVPLSKIGAALLWHSIEERAAEAVARWFSDRERRERRRQRRRRAAARSKRRTAS